ncbi:glycosyltransferase [Alteromonas aestuariivivens]|uniref:Glycosyltransferase n=2 Tax=Alteromonas aestuariivivens TaxID=1938339 RepID=A0A3D8M5K4_9ALTE|nr:glycosyltransferase [Alteromonas aestuariivivens]RDV24432.1 glycosyltransferase [Alteromonas aestuariivivens]
MAVYREDNPGWVEQAIASIIGQTYTEFALIIVIDGEIGASLYETIQSFAESDNRLVLLKNHKNFGLAQSMNHAIEWGFTLSPRYFVRMDADDVATLNRLARQIGYLEHHKNIAILGSSLTEIDENGKKVGARVMPASHLQIVRMLPRRCSMNHPTVTIRYDVFHDGFRYDSSLRNTQDYFLWIELAQNGYLFRNLKDKLLKFRRVNDFYKRRGLGKSFNEFKARMFAMKSLRKYSAWNLGYACGVLVLRLMPAQMVKLAYKLDRLLLEKYVKH